MVGRLHWTSFETEGHFATVMFDGQIDALPNDIPAFGIGNDLWVTETIQTSDNLETLEFMIYGGDGTTAPPAAGSYGPLFFNTLDDLLPTELSLDGLFWVSPPDSQAAVLSNLVLRVGTDGGLGSTVITPGFLSISGSGSQADPFLVFLEIEQLDMAKATDITVRFDVEHTPVPEPSVAALLALGTVGLSLHARSRRLR